MSIPSHTEIFKVIHPYVVFTLISGKGQKIVQLVVVALLSVVIRLLVFVWSLLKLLATKWCMHQSVADCEPDTHGWPTQLNSGLQIGTRPMTVKLLSQLLLRSSLDIKSFEHFFGLLHVHWKRGNYSTFHTIEEGWKNDSDSQLGLWFCLSLVPYHMVQSLERLWRFCDTMSDLAVSEWQSSDTLLPRYWKVSATSMGTLLSQRATFSGCWHMTRILVFLQLSILHRQTKLWAVIVV